MRDQAQWLEDDFDALPLDPDLFDICVYRALIRIGDPFEFGVLPANESRKCFEFSYSGIRQRGAAGEDLRGYVVLRQSSAVYHGNDVCAENVFLAGHDQLIIFSAEGLNRHHLLGASRRSGLRHGHVERHIAVWMDGEPIREYAARNDADENNITQKLKRAEKKLREKYLNRQI